MLFISTVRRVAVFAVAVLFACNALAAIGTVQFVYGDVRVRDAAGTVRPAKKGDAINEGDTILTGSVASAQLKMSDDGILAIRPGSELTLDIYRFFGKEDGRENAVMSLVRGGFRTITGIIGRTNRDNYRVRAGTATIGIRGTDHEPFLVLPALPGAPQPIAPPGAYDKVNVGAAYISGPLGTVNVAANQVGFAGPSAAPTILPVMPAFFKATPPIQASAPATGTTASSGETASTTTTTQVRESAVVDSTATATSPTTTTTTDTTTTSTATTSPTTTTVTQTVSGETTAGTIVDLTAQTATTTTGTPVPITQATYAIEAQTAADEAQVDAGLALTAFNTAATAETMTNSALTTLSALATVSTVPATTAISSATSAYNSAQSAVSALGTPVDTSAASAAITTATTDVNSAQTAVTAVNALPSPNVALATANATSSASLAGTAATQTQLAQTNIDSGFADAIYALPANATVQSANTSAQSANSLVQTAAATAVTQGSAFTAAQTSANTALGSATTSLGAANTALTAAQADNAAFSAALASAQAALASAATALAQANASLSAANSGNSDLLAAQNAVSGLSSTAAAAVSAAQTASVAAQTAATDAQTAATLAAQRQAAGDLTGAQTALQTALTQLGIAQTQLSAATTAQAQAQATTTTANNQLAAAQSAVSAATTAVTGAIAAANSAQSSATSAQSSATTASSKLTSVQTNVNTAIAQAGSAQSSAATAQSEAGTATTSQAAAVSAVNTTTSELANEQSAANTVAANYIRAQYSNPAVASSTFQNFVLSQKPVSGGSELGSTEAIQPQANSTYVLNENKDLIEIRSNAYSRIGLNYEGQTQISDANIKFSGGAAKDHFNAADGTMYMGRWQGGQIDVTDLAASGAVAPFSDSLGSTSAHWVVALPAADSPLSTPLAPISNVQTLLGSASYSLLAATHPTDALGNVGTLNSASLAANFTKQTVDASLNLSFSTADPVNLSARNLGIAASASNAPITRGGFDGTFATTVCTGAACEANFYFGLFYGGFGASASGGTTTGAVGNLAALGYRFFTVPASLGPNQPFSELIDGAAVFSTASTPTPGVTPTAVCATCAFRSAVFYPIDGSAGLTFFGSSGVPALGGTSTIPAANYVFDSSGNLVRILISSWNAYERATGSQCTGGAPCLTSPGPGTTANAMLTMAGGTVGTGGATFSSSSILPTSTTATERYSDSTGIRMGRYEGGTVIVQDLATDERLESGLTGLSGPRSVQWAVREQPASIPISGNFDFAPTFATKPTDSFGSTNGALLNAQLTAKFSSMTVQPAVRVSINNQTLGGSASGVPIFPGSFGFDVSSSSVTDTTFNPSAPVALQVGCAGTNCAPVPAGGGRPYGGRIIGGFSGDGTADGAFFRYIFNTRFNPANSTDVATAASLSRPINDYIVGNVAFGKAAELRQPAPDGAARIQAAYFYMPVGGTYATDDQFRTSNYNTSPTSYTITSGNLVSASDDATFEFPVRSESISGGTPASGGITAAGQASALAATGIIFGRYDAMKPDGSGTLATLTGSEEQNGVATSFTRNVLGSYHWFKGPEAFPFGLPGMLTGTASYSLAGYTRPTDQNSLLGSVSEVSTDTNLSVNFDLQAVTLNMKVTMPPSIGPVPGSLDRVWLANAPNIRLGDGFRGEFFAYSGASLGSHQILSVTLNGNPGFGNIAGSLTGTRLNGAGVAYAFGGSDPSNGGSHEHVNGALAFAMSSYGPGTGALAPSGTSVNLDDVWYRYLFTTAGMLPAGAFTSDGWDNHSVQPASVSVLRITQDANLMPVRFDSRFPVVSPSGCTSGCSVFEIPVRMSVEPAAVANAATALSTTATAASLVDTGIDPVTGTRWGRYAGGAVAVFDRISGAARALIDTTSQPMHFLMTTAQSGPTALPISGTANYALIGNTSPTDNFGNVGTLGSATLSANFGAQTVSSSVALTVNSQNWSASMTDAPILKGAVFFAEKLINGGGSQVPLNVASSLGTNTAGTLIGVFTGTSGQGAGLAYSLNHGGHTATNPSATTVSGVAAFRKP